MSEGGGGGVLCGPRGVSFRKSKETVPREQAESSEKISSRNQGTRIRLQDAFSTFFPHATLC